MYFVTDFSSIFAVVAPFEDRQLVFPVDEITDCTVPHISAYAGKSQCIAHVKELLRNYLPFIFFVLQ